MQIPKVAVILGTRPEAIKLAPVVLALRALKNVDIRVCLTGQHRELLRGILETFNIAPDDDLEILRPNQSLADLTAHALQKIDGYLSREQPQFVLAQGDTTTVLAAALACFYRRAPFGHVEAGLRTGNLNAPWPEEANRVLASRLAALHFAPTDESRQNLLKEGVDAAAIHVTGNTVIDALLAAREKIRAAPPVIPGLGADVLKSRIVLITGHRRENVGAGFESICAAIGELARNFSDVQFVYPLHLNPNVREPVKKALGGVLANVHLIEPLEYLPFVALMDRCELILTDSGGVQEEAPSLGKPVLVLRETTERPEAVAAGTVKLVGSDRARIVAEASRLLTDRAEYERMSRAHNPYGDGHAAERIAKIVSGFLANLKSDQS